MYQTATFLFIDGTLQHKILTDIPSDQSIRAMCERMSDYYFDPDDDYDIYDILYQTIELCQRSAPRLLDDIMLLSIRNQFDWKEEFEQQGFSVHIIEEYNTIIEVEIKSNEGNDYS